ncbi:MAG: phosphoribosylformimino-5-aminoimidazole carboxamide ribotide isomerase [Thermodesulfobacteriota bacterium]|nr:phosphoribosylformimino-5-aminoimidazole carboxamide ribotide isomerase [Thermodesulfobacteriota bacterium]
MKFRPCIDIRNKKVVQIIGSTINDRTDQNGVLNFQADQGPAEFAAMYKKDDLFGGHVISLGPGNQDAVVSALKAFPGGLHAGGGITPKNALEFLRAGASHVIVTSYVFTGGQIDQSRLEAMVKETGKEHLVLDLSCRFSRGKYWIVTDRWQTFTDVAVSRETLEGLADYCDEFLVHGVDVEGKMQGIETDLVELLGKYSPIPVTYAGGVKAFSDLDRVKQIGQGRVDLTIGSGLDIFGGGISYRKVVKWHQKQQKTGRCHQGL